MTASDALRVNADGTYEWKSSFAATVKGRWTPAPDGPGIVVKDSKGRTWTLRNETNETTERIRKLESARLYPSDRSEMSQVATRPLKRLGDSALQRTGRLGTGPVLFFPLLREERHQV